MIDTLWLKISVIGRVDIYTEFDVYIVPGCVDVFNSIDGVDLVASLWLVTQTQTTPYFIEPTPRHSSRLPKFESRNIF